MRAQPQAEGEVVGGVLPPCPLGRLPQLPHGAQPPCCGEAQTNHMERPHLRVLVSGLGVAPANSRHRLPGQRVKTPPDDPSPWPLGLPGCQAFQLRPQTSWERQAVLTGPCPNSQPIGRGSINTWVSHVVCFFTSVAMGTVTINYYYQWPSYYASRMPRDKLLNDATPQESRKTYS